MQGLQKITFKELYIAGNPLTETKNYVNDLKLMFPSLQKIVGVSVFQPIVLIM